jgi:hypothetical protein
MNGSLRMPVNARFVRLVVGVLAFAFLTAPGLARAADPDVSSRSLVIAVSKDAPPEIQSAAKAIAAAVKDQPLLKVMAQDHDAKTVDTALLLKGPVQDRAFNHLVIIGLPDDVLVATVWQREAAIEPGGIFVFGFGHFKGDIGYIESDRNPFMHSEAVARAPYETEIVTITGTTAAGVAMAADALLHRNVINGVIAAGNSWSRPSTSLLDRDPISSHVALPDIPAEIGGSPLIGTIQASGDEFGNALADTGELPTSIWRFKYAVNGAWDGAGSGAAIAEYNAGLHRRAHADMLWVGGFSSPEAAASAAKKIAAATGLSSESNGKWSGNGKTGNGEPESLWIQGTSVYMSDLK